VILHCNPTFTLNALLSPFVVQTVVRPTEGYLSKAFNVKVGLHQGSILSPLLFVIVMETITREPQADLSLNLLYADDLMLMAESEESLM